MIQRIVLFAAVCCILQNAAAQPIARPVPFALSPFDSSANSVLPSLPRSLEDRGWLHSSPSGKLIDSLGDRARLFGTELQWTSQFLTSDAANILAGRLGKLGFNAVRLIYNDYFGWDDASLVRTTTETGQPSPSTYQPNPVSFARLDTLIAALRRNGIYTLLPIHSTHRMDLRDGVPTSDSSYWNSYLLHFLYPEALATTKRWTRTLLSRRNPLTALTYGEDPGIPILELLQDQSLFWFWQLDRLNYVGPDQALDRGLATISYHQSRRLDTLYNSYLLRKYGNQPALNVAWMGPGVSGAANQVDNGSFEKIGSAIWSFNIANGAEAAQVLFSGGIDSAFSNLIHISKSSATKYWYDVLLANTSPRLKRDSAYELRFWAKIKYDPANPVLQRSVVAVIVHTVQTYPTSLEARVTMDTSWKEYILPFRCAIDGAQVLYLGLGEALGDVLLDAVSINRRSEPGLEPGESLTTASVRRIKFSEAQAVSPNRLKDQTSFYADLELAFFNGLRSFIKDSLGYRGLVNFTQTSGNTTIMDIRVASEGDVMMHHGGWDYIAARPGRPYNDSTWMVNNYAITQDAGNSAIGVAAANAVHGKPFILGAFRSPTPNQQLTANAIHLPAYASLQDWDGIFFTPYATFREELFTGKLFTIPGNDLYSTLAQHHTFMSLMPLASKVFREELIAPSRDSVVVTHTSDQMFRYASWRDYRFPFGVEGYLDLNIATQSDVRQRFDQPNEKVAAEYPYVSDTVAKRSSTEEILWDQTNATLKVAAPGVYMYAGRGASSVEYPGFTFGRLDGSNDMTAMYLLPLDSSTVQNSQRLLFTLATRTQNSGMGWIDSFGYGNAWGSAPTIMSAAKITLSLSSDKEQVLIYPLTPEGNRSASPILATKFGDRFEATIDQLDHPSVWFEIVKSEEASTGGQHDATNGLRLSQSPAVDRTHAQFELDVTANIELSVIDQLGRTRWHHVERAKSPGSHAIAIDVSSLEQGAYTVVLQQGLERNTRSLAIIR